MNKKTVHAAVLLMFAVALGDGSAAEPVNRDAFARASRSAAIAGATLSKMHRWLHGTALPTIDPQTGLYIADGHWNYRDTAADCYPFFAWAAWAVDREVFNGPVRAVLHAEQKLCNKVDRIPLPYDLKKGQTQALSYEEMVFQASEYVKDGLIAIVEMTGKDEWFDRMRGIEDDLWKHARIETPFGKIPSRNIEVNGEQIQALTRLYTMTGDARYLVWAPHLTEKVPWLSSSGPETIIKAISSSTSRVIGSTWDSRRTGRA